MNFEDVKKFLSENKDKDEVANFLKEMKKEGLLDFVKSDDGYKIIKPLIDQKISGALETYKDKTLPQLLQTALQEKTPELEKEIKTKYGVKDPEHPELASLRKEMAEMQKRLAAETQHKEKIEKISLIKGEAEKYGLGDFAERFISETPEQTQETFGKFKEKLDTYVQSKIEETVKTGKYTPHKTSTGGKELDWKNMTEDELSKLPVETLDKILDGKM